jgi:hypothetical protein
VSDAAGEHAETFDPLAALQLHLEHSAARDIGKNA